MNGARGAVAPRVEVRERPLVSAITPAFNAQDSLTWAIASLQAQDYDRWEAVIVDDGSTDGTWDLLNRLDDPRIRTLRLGRNQGRGAARAAALAETRGTYLAMVDADDWVYPWKLSRQVAVMEQAPELCLVSGCYAVMDAAGAMIGRQGPETACRRTPMRRPRHPEMPHGPSMFRADIARSLGYDPSFRFSEDSDLMLRMRLHHPSLELPEVFYAYWQPASMSLEKMLRSYAAGRRYLAKHRREYPMAVLVEQARTHLKGLVYRAAYATGRDEALIARRWRDPTPAERAEFERARAVVAEHRTRLLAALGR